MRSNPERCYRRSIRLPKYDYGRPGAYFLTVCTHERRCLFGQITDGEMRLNHLGRIAFDEWLRTGEMRPRIRLDAFVVMPNHIHGIIVITDDFCRGTLQRAPTTRRAPTIERFGRPTSDTIPTMIRLFKSATTKRINQLRSTPGAVVWQRNYYEHVIRNEADWHHIRNYIQANPVRWLEDRENPHGETEQ